jgi:hypothetical protein
MDEKIIRRDQLKLMGWFLLTFTPRWVRAITLWPFGIYFRSKANKTVGTIKHELEYHWPQQKEMPVIFYIWYVIEFLIKIPFCGKKAYLSISFEQEAYKQYGIRKPYGWDIYVFKCYCR